MTTPCRERAARAAAAPFRRRGHDVTRCHPDDGRYLHRSRDSCVLTVNPSGRMLRSGGSISLKAEARLQPIVERVDTA